MQQWNMRSKIRAEWQMKKIKEKELQGLEVFCILTALAAIILGILFLFNFWQNHWFLNFILGLGILLHVALLLLFILRHKMLYTVGALFLVIFYSSALIYFNFG